MNVKCQKPNGKGMTKGQISKTFPRGSYRTFVVWALDLI
jgi:hypothetical protein